MKKKILLLRKKNKSFREIRDILGCSLSTISYHCSDGQKGKTQERNRRNKRIASLRVDTIIKRRFLNLGIKKCPTTKKTIREKPCFTLSEFNDMIKANKVCYITGMLVDIQNAKSWELDHIKPTSKGGKDNLKNLRPVVRIANRLKSELTVKELLRLCEMVLKNHNYIVYKKP